MNYYNEFDPKAAAWLRQLIADQLIPEGIVDERSITEVRPDDLLGFTQCHFFCGIAGWSRALQLAGWPADRPVWTGSCPCQPFSNAGAGLGTADPRHLWPVFRELIRQRRPGTAFIEQVASKAGRAWLAGVRTDLEAAGYSFAAVNLCAGGVRAPHLRQRLYGVAESVRAGVRRGEQPGPGAVRGEAGEHPHGTGAPEQPGDGGDAAGSGTAGGVSDAASPRHHGPERFPEGEARHETRVLLPGADGESSGPAHHRLADAECSQWRQEPSGLEGRDQPEHRGGEPRRLAPVTAGPVAQGGFHGSARGFWDAYDLIAFRDGKVRRIEPGAFPVAHGVPKGMVPRGDPGDAELQATREAGIVRIKGYGNAIVPELAAEFIRAYLETLP